MRVGILLLTTWSVAALFLGGLPAGGAAQTPGADWADIQGIAVGDHWTFRVSGQESGEIRNEVVAQEKKRNEFGSTWESFRIHASGDLTSRQRPNTLSGTPLATQSAEVDIHVEIDKWVRTTDYAVVQLEGETEIGDNAGQTKTDVVEAYDPPLVETVFPFTTGYKWRTGAYHYLERGSEADPGTKLEILYEVLGIENVTVPAGTFRAWKVQVTGGEDPDTFKYQWYAEEVCDLVKEERYRHDAKSGTLINTLELLDWDCARTDKANPTYDPDWVELVTTGGNVPPLEGFDKHDPPTVTQGAPGAGYITFLLVAAGVVAAAGAAMLVWHVRR